jgi:hypothetical protein
MKNLVLVVLLLDKARMNMALPKEFHQITFIRHEVKSSYVTDMSGLYIYQT